jgi:predicted MFS family arabinose efflux permease
MLPAVGLVSSSLFLMPFATSQEQLLALVAVFATGATLVNSTPPVFVADVTTEENRGQALAMLRSAGDAGLMVGAGLFGALSHHSSPTAAFGLASIVLLATGVNFSMYNSPPKPAATESGDDASRTPPSSPGG